MKENREMKYIRIDSKNNFTSFDNESLLKFKIKLYTQLSEFEEVDNFYITKYLEKIFFKNQEFFTVDRSKIIHDFLIFSKKISKDHLRCHLLKNFVSDTQSFRLENNSFELNEINIINISKILINNFYRIAKKFNINNCQDFLHKLELDDLNCNCNNKNIKKEYESFLDLKISTANFKLNLNSTIQKIREIKQKLYMLCDGLCSKKKEKKEIFPKQLKELVDHFKDVKHLKIILPDKKGFNIYDYFLVLTNLKWLFPNVLEVFIDMECELYKRIINFYSESNQKNIYDLIDQNKNVYELILFIPYYVSVLDIRFLKINLPESYDNELDFLLKNQKILATNFNILDIFDLMTNLVCLDLTFNSLDSNNFRKIFNFIHKNNNLKILSLNLFPRKNTEEFFSNHNISKLSNLFDLNFETNLKKSFSYNIDENEFLLNLLSQQFQDNLLCLIHILNGKIHNLNNLKINFDLPGVFFLNDKYLNLLQKLILNLFLLITNENSNLHTFEINSKNFSFDSRRFPNINSYMSENINLENIKIKNFLINFRFNNIEIKHLIPFKNVEFLSLEELDLNSFKKFNEILKNKNNFKNLVHLKITLSHLINLSSRICFHTILDFFSLLKIHKNLCEVTFKILTKLNLSDIENILNIIKHDRIERYNLYFSEKSYHVEIFNEYIKTNPFYSIKNDQRIFSIIQCLNKSKNFDLMNGKLKIIEIINNCLQKKKDKIIDINIEYPQ